MQTSRSQCQTYRGSALLLDFFPFLAGTPYLNQAPAQILLMKDIARAARA